MTSRIPFVLLFFLLLAHSALAGDIRVTDQFISEKTDGPPLQVSSMDKVSNLNADYLDGMTSADFAGVTELATAAGGVDVHWKNITNVPGVAIDQDCAVSTGCDTGSDSSGFPVTITQPGSYRLASNLSTGSENTTLISIESSNVTLDLHGFSLSGPVSCTGTPVTSCSPTGGSGRGVDVPASTGRTGITILNGTIEGMGQHGIACDAPCKVVQVHVAENDSVGVFATSNSIVENVLAARNRLNGIALVGVLRDCISTGSGGNGISVQGSIINCRSAQNGGAGISITGSIRNSVADSNQSIGISLADGSTAIGNTSNNNDVEGFNANSTATFKGNTAYNNTSTGFVGSGVFVGNTSDGNSNGFSCSNCLLINNIARNNSNNGVAFSGTDSAWAGNLLTGNGSTFSGSVVDLGNNACNGSTTC